MDGPLVRSTVLPQPSELGLCSALRRSSELRRERECGNEQQHDWLQKIGAQRPTHDNLLGGLVPPDASSEQIVSPRETGEELRRGPVPVTELRAGVVVGPGSAAFEVMRDLVYHVLRSDTEH
jgi:hypothetical protein